MKLGGVGFNGQILRVRITPVFIGTGQRFYPSKRLIIVVNTCVANINYREFSDLCELSASEPVNICNHG